jgi:hypothetical protein
MTSQQQDKEIRPDYEITLHYIDKLFASRNVSIAVARRYTVFSFVLSVVLLAVSGGIASAEENMDLSGLGLKVPLAVFLTAGALTVGVLTVASYGIRQQWRPFRWEIRRLYRSIGFEDRTLYGRIVNPYRTGDLVTTLITVINLETYRDIGEDQSHGVKPPRKTIHTTLRIVRGLLTFLLFLLVPIAAEVAAGFKVADLLQKSAVQPVGFLFTVLVVVTAAGVSLAIAGYLHYERRWAPRVEHSSTKSHVEGGFEDDEEVNTSILLIALLFLIVISTLSGAGLGYTVAEVLSQRQP